MNGGFFFFFNFIIYLLSSQVGCWKDDKCLNPFDGAWDSISQGILLLRIFKFLDSCSIYRHCVKFHFFFLLYN